ncbi:uncharacterized protein B0I36DRAFT_346192 [Microdochium trichocladiopsis]|uniref:EF-hand domain-containing protein n=1 Tax=Microdochium trichocladiopsis TaxID=1682393 RepID=A0A9P9BYM4_9PEZI|nr:uncharacterized protein B0I36DRAFT_346192 [Microdochium trichocladiopsis]KAH7038188.1 hypothetical protein B0I36DRAFT_346192 [Microdochium trichocladiopsis]
MSAASGYKPSPLGYGSPARNSPFRRPESPASPSQATNSQYSQRGNITPTTSPTKPSGASFAHSRLGSTASAASPPTSPSMESGNRTPRFGGGVPPGGNSQNHLGSPVTISRAAPTKQPSSNGNALSQLQPSQVRTLREGFQILDRNSDGVVTREDVADMLDQLGLPSSQSELSQFFPPSAPQTMTLAVFINSIATTLAAMSPSTELLSAFSAFDDDDSGQIDVAELRDALLNTAPEPGERSLTPAEVDRIVSGFSGRRAFSKSSVMAAARDQHGGGFGAKGKGEVFKYHDFVQSIVGGGKDNSETNSSHDDGSED